MVMPSTLKVRLVASVVTPTPGGPDGPTVPSLPSLPSSAQAERRRQHPIAAHAHGWLDFGAGIVICAPCSLLAACAPSMAAPPPGALTYVNTCCRPSGLPCAPLRRDPAPVAHQESPMASGTGTLIPAALLALAFALPASSAAPDQVCMDCH